MKAEIKKAVSDLGLNIHETDFVEDLGMIRNKYYTGFIMTSDMGKFFEHQKTAIKMKKERIKKAMEDNDIMLYIVCHERPFRLQAFLEAEMEMKLFNYEIGKALAFCWTDSESPYINISTWKELFKKYGKFTMTKEERKFLKNLPKRVKIYRGTVEHESKDSGISYTLDMEVAEWFSKRFSQVGGVISKTVERSRIMAYFEGRNEKEIIFI